jgi:MFS transporter, OFA family, oxalate/formate antiporter
MAEGKVMNRWIVVVGAILIQLCLGAIYAWSVFTPGLTKAVADGGNYGFTPNQAMAIFSVGLATFAVVMVIAGRMQAKVGPRPIAALGGIVLGAGYIAGGFLGKTFLMQLICIGLVGGAGIGLAYVVPIAVCVKWFPDKKGMITGMAVAGFGFGATIWVKLGGSWFGGLLNLCDGMMGLPGVQAVFVIYGVTFLVGVLLGSIVMINPPDGFKPAGWNPPAPSATSVATGAVDLTEGQMLATPQYWMLLLMFISSGMAGLMVIGCISLFGIDALQASGAAADKTAAAAMAGTAMALYAILNGLGRIVWGTVSDTIGRKFSLFLMCLAQGIIMLAFFYIGGSKIGLIVGACIIGFNFGGNFALFPAATADFFGNKNVGKNYGWVFLAYGVAGIVGPMIAGVFKGQAVAAANALKEQTANISAAEVAQQTLNYWLTPFVIAGVACLVAAVLALLLKAPKAKNA